MEIVVFTNGCFDLLHAGHIELLKKARQLGTKLIVGLNSDSSVRAIKGAPRPYLNEDARAAILRELRSVDEVRIFEENTPEILIKEIKPDVLVKGGDWAVEEIVGAEYVLKNGGKVFSIPFESDLSSSKIVEKIKKSIKGESFDSRKKDLVQNFIENSLRECTRGLQDLLDCGGVENIQRCADLIRGTIEQKNKVWLCAETYSAEFTQFLAMEFTSDLDNRREIPSFDSNNFWFNDRNFKLISASQVEMSAVPGDLLIGIDPKGSSPEVVSSVIKARQMNCRTIALTGMDGKKLASLCDANVYVPLKSKTRIKETILVICHIWREIISQRTLDGSEKKNEFTR